MSENVPESPSKTREYYTLDSKSRKYDKDADSQGAKDDAAKAPAGPRGSSRQPSDLYDSRYWYTDPAPMYGDTELRWRTSEKGVREDEPPSYLNSIGFAHPSSHLPREKADVAKGDHDIGVSSRKKRGRPRKSKNTANLESNQGNKGDVPQAELDSKRSRPNVNQFMLPGHRKSDENNVVSSRKNRGRPRKSKNTANLESNQGNKGDVPQAELDSKRSRPNVNQFMLPGHRKSDENNVVSSRKNRGRPRKSKNTANLESSQGNKGDVPQSELGSTRSRPGVNDFMLLDHCEPQVCETRPSRERMEPFDELPDQEDQARINTHLASNDKTNVMTVKSILRKPTERFPEEAQFSREGVTPLWWDWSKDVKAKDIPKDANNSQLASNDKTNVMTVKSILRKPTERFPEEAQFSREGVAPLWENLSKDAKAKNIPKDAKWTKIDRRLVNPQALEEKRERFEERLDCVIVLRVLTRDEIQALADRTAEIRDEREERNREESVARHGNQSDSVSGDSGQTQPTTSFSYPSDDPTGIVEHSRVPVKSENLDSLLDSSESDSDSYEDSVFSAGATSMTSRSSVISVGPSSTILDQLVALLLEQDRFAHLCKSAIERRWIGPQKFERLFRKLLKNYGAALKTQTDGSTGQRRAAANFFHGRARLAASKIRRCFDKHSGEHLDVPEDKADKRSQILDYLYELQNSSEVEYIREDGDSGDSSEDDGIPNDEHPDRLSQVDGVRDFLTKDVAYEALCGNLEKVVNPSWEDRVEDFFDEIARRSKKRGFEDNSFGQLRSVVAELLVSDQYSVDFLEEYDPSWVEKTQSWVERKTGTRWDWWPLETPRVALQDNSIIGRFRCGCGELQWRQLPKNVVPMLKQFLQHRTEYVLAMGGGQSSRPCFGGDPGDSGKHSVSFGIDANHVDPRGGSKDTSAPSIAGTQGMKLYGKTLTANHLHIFFTVNNNDNHCLAQIETDMMHDDSFFVRLKDEYIWKRGRIRMLFSIWRYAGSEFRKLEKIMPKRVVPFPQIELPEPSNVEYHYRLRPTDAVPPIGRHEFKMRYYECLTGGVSHSHWWRACRKQCRRKKDALEKIPKRDRAVIEDGDDREVFWGLLAVEEIQFVRVLIYHILCLTGPLVFWVLWITAGHPGDLQNASVPMTVALGFVALLSSSWFVLGGR